MAPLEHQGFLPSQSGEAFGHTSSVPDSALFLTIDLVGTFVFALNGSLTAIRVAHLDLFGVTTLGIVTAIGGGVTRDLLLGATPPASFQLWYYLAVAVAGGITAFLVGHRGDSRRFRIPILVLDAAGLSLFAVVGAKKALDFGLGVAPAILLGTLTAVGGGTLRDMMVKQIPTVLHSELYAVPALAGSTIVVFAAEFGWNGWPPALIGAAICLGIRGLGLHLKLNAPRVKPRQVN